MTSRSEDAPASHPQPRRARPPADRAIEPTAAAWAERANMAESAVLSRHLRTLWGIPGAELAVVGWPATRRERIFATWDYWWQAHLLDCVIDAANREATPARTRRIAAIAHGHRVRNITGWTNDYYDDMAWLALALERADRTRGLTDLRGGLAALEKEIVEGWQSPAGAMPWRKGADYFNAPANGPVGILLARLGRHARAREVADWLHETLRDPETGLILDGIHLPSGELERPVFTYCQGTVLGLETELAVRTGEFEHVDRVQQLLCAVEEHLTADAVVTGGGGGDGGLFNGILARYLAVVAVMLPGEGAAQVAARRTAARIVTCSARAAWDHRLEVEGEPLFGHDWSRPARMPTGTFGAGYVSVGGSVVASRNPERDLSVQLSGWLLMEAAHLVTAAGF